MLDIVTTLIIAFIFAVSFGINFVNGINQIYMSIITKKDKLEGLVELAFSFVLFGLFIGVVVQLAIINPNTIIQLKKGFGL